MIKKLLLLFLICIVSALNINADVYEGSCGPNVRYSLDTSTGVLKITGTGAMDDFEWKDDYLDYDTPWRPYKAYLKTVDITNGVTSVGKYAFHGCSNLTEVKISNSVTSIGKWAFHGCSALTSINIPDGVTSIGTETFRRCTNLATIVIPDNVTSIGGEAFFECSSLTSLSLGSGIETISNSFKKCPNLTEVYCNAKNVPNTSARAFIDSHVEKATLYVPATSLETYKATEPWSGFGNVLPLEGHEPIPDTGPDTLRGDTNGDGKIDMNDATFVVNIILGTEEATEAADVNFDGAVNMPDAMYIVNKILNGKFPDEKTK